MLGTARLKNGLRRVGRLLLQEEIESLKRDAIKVKARSKEREGRLRAKLEKLKGEREKDRARADRFKTRDENARSSLEREQRRHKKTRSKLSAERKIKAEALDVLRTNVEGGNAAAADLLSQNQELVKQSHQLRSLLVHEDPVRAIAQHLELNPSARAARSLLENYLTDGAGKTLLINDTRSQNNVGCRATSVATHDSYEAAGLEMGRLVALSELYELWSLLEEEVGTAPTDQNLNVYLERFETSATFRLYREIIADASNVVVNGEGSFYDRQGKALLVVVMSLFAIRNCNKPVAFVNFSAALQDDVLRAWAFAAFHEARVLSLRESMSLEFFEGSDLAPFATFDAAFSYAKNPPLPLDSWNWKGLHPNETLYRIPPKPFVVITGTSAIFRPDREASNPWEGVTALVRSLREAGLECVLYAAASTDERLLCPIAVSERCGCVSAATPVEVIRSLLSEAVAMVSGRWHASILATTVGTPSILGDANFFKTKALHDYLDLGVQMFEYRALPEQSTQIVSDVLALRQQGQAVREQVLQKAHAAAADYETAVARVVQSLKR